VPRSRKSGYARDDKGEGDAFMENGCWTEAIFIPFGWAAGPLTTPVYTNCETALVRHKAVLLCRLKLVIHHSGD
jgi:hypothetical protein